MDKVEVMAIGELVAKEFKVNVTPLKNGLLIDTPKQYGLGKVKDKIDLVEQFTNKVVDRIRAFDIVFDVMVDITYETIKVTFIG